MPPSGRAMNPTAKVLNDAICATSGGRSAREEQVGKTSAAAVP
jgi:O-acetylhomoserine/O-acetylserine sulfhydrylase-like pyridoxal-dependent enzyme